MLRELAILGAVGLLAACGFPQVSYEAADGGPAGAQEAGVDAAPVADGASADGSSGPGDGSEPADGALDGDASGAADSTAGDAPVDAVDDYVFEASADAPVCDHDQDNDLAPGSTCGGTDCDDDDPRAFSGEPDYLTFAPTSVTKGDWNCDGVVSTEYTTGFSCGAINLGSCGTAAGFRDTPGCGASSNDFITCKAAGALCVVDATTTKTQGCK